MNISATPIDGVFVVESKKVSDQRGSFSRVFCNKELSSIFGDREVVQINLSKNRKKGSVRGMHFQLPPYAEMKLIRCVKGKVFDVAVDLRTGSKTFLKWYGIILNPEKNNMLVIPEGCAHGFQTLEDDTELLYLHTSYYEPEYERGFLFNDSAVNIKWPLACTDVSEKDKKHPIISQSNSGIDL